MILFKKKYFIVCMKKVIEKLLD